MMDIISNSQVENTVRPYGVELELGVVDKIRSYTALLIKWNRTISLTTVIDPIEILKFHFGESIFAVSELNFYQSRLADVGSGAGFPGIPLAMTVPSLDVTLIESNSKKCAFLSEVVRELRLPNVKVLRERIENVDSGPRQFDFIAARALGHHNELLAWAKKNVSASGKVVLWLGAEDSRELCRRTDWRWQVPKLIPGSDRRYLLVGSPIL
jgi:16S rRNA (guanine527-N7)-methyltransferase